MICFLRSSSIACDPRLYKYIIACKHTNTNYFAITWNRLLDNQDKDIHEYQFKKYAPYGYGQRLKNFLLLIEWYFYVVFFLIKRRKTYALIHACNIETVCIAYVFKVLLHKKYIFDIYDTSGKFVLERFFAKHADLLILPHEMRLQQLSLKKENLKNYLTIENVPVLKRPSKCDEIEHKKKKGEVHLSYVGAFERKIRGLETLVDVVEKNNHCYLEIAGSGSGLELFVEEASKRCNRIKYHHFVSYDDALTIMNRNDYIVAMYNSPLSHKYACPNKFYESLLLGRPIITTKETSIGQWVKNYDTGFTINSDYNSFESLIHYLLYQPSDEYCHKQNNCLECWKCNYVDYQKTQLEGAWLDLCKIIINDK